MQINGYPGDRDVRHDQRVEENLPTGCMQQAVREKVQNRVYSHYHSKKNTARQAGCQPMFPTKVTYVLLFTVIIR
jgi:hypothetical protein